MELLYKPDFEDARAHWEAFWQQEIIDRPCLGVTAPREGCDRPPGPPYMDGWDGEFEDAVARWEAFASATYYGGDAIPHFLPSFGPDQFGAFIGADLERRNSPTSWAVPFVENWEDVLPLELSPDSPWWQKMLEFMRTAARASEGKYLVGMLDLHSNLDALASIREPQDVATDLLDCPGLVHQAMADVRAMYSQIYDGLHEAGGMEGRGTIGWLAFYSRERFTTIQCDFAIMVSPEQFDEFIRPALVEETEFLDHSIYHYDGIGALRHLQSVLSIPQLDGIQWVPGAGNPPQFQWADLLRQIQDAGKTVHVSASPGEIKQLHGKLQPERVFYQTSTKSEREADALIKWFVDHT